MHCSESVVLTLFLLGEPRADIYGDTPFGGEATQGMERLPYNTINKENVGISNFAGMYKVINQINLMIAKNERDLYIARSQQKILSGRSLWYACLSLFPPITVMG